MSPLRRPQIAFLCRGSTRDGLGHVTRTIAIAKKVKELAGIQIVSLGDEAVRRLLRDADLEHIHCQNEIEATLALERFRPETVVFDLLQVCDPLFDRFRHKARTISLSPIFNRLHDVDLVFHRTVYLDDTWPVGSAGFPEVRFGLQFAVIRDACARIDRKHFEKTASSHPLSLLISMGGTDAGNKTLTLLKSLREYPRPLLIWVLLGEGYSHSYQSLMDCVNENDRHEIIVAKTYRCMARVMAQCSLAILAGGMMAYEAAYAGLPSINFLENSDRSYLIRELTENGVCEAHFESTHQFSISLQQRIEPYDLNRDELIRMHEKSFGLLDRNGASRIAEQIVSFQGRHDFRIKQSNALDVSSESPNANSQERRVSLPVVIAANHSILDQSSSVPSCPPSN